MALITKTSNRRTRRNQFHLIAEVLKASKDGLTKTQIMYKAHLSFAQLTRYLPFLLEISLLKTVEVDEKTIYKTTAKGTRFLQRYEEIKQLLKSF